MSEVLLRDVPIGALFRYRHELFRRGKWKMDDDHPCSDLTFTAMPVHGHGGLRAIPELVLVEMADPL